MMRMAATTPPDDSAAGSPTNLTPASPAHPHFQVHVHQCPDCARASIQTSRGELPISPATSERIQCDSRIATPDRRNTATIPPRRRRQVLSRDRHRCRRPGCTSTRFLEVHHLVPRENGGGNDPENLITLCAACHQLLHENAGPPLTWCGSWNQPMAPGFRVSFPQHRGTKSARARLDNRFGTV
jgi:5-methylcytosine-specific restriction endonuclease McrA